MITDGRDGVARLWDLASHRQIGPPLEEEKTFSFGVAQSVAYGTLNNRPIAVKGAGDLAIWELTGHEHAQKPGKPRHIRYGSPGSVYTVACAVLNGRSVAVTGAYDSSVRMWDLATGTQIGKQLSGHGSVVRSVAAGMLAGRAIAVSSSEDHTIRVWDLADGTQIGPPLTGHTGHVWAVDMGLLNGRPIAVSGGDDHTVRVWDLANGRQIGAPLIGHTNKVRAIAYGAPDGQPIAVSGGDHTVRVWDLRTRRQIGHPMRDSRGLSIGSIAYILHGGRPRVVAADIEGRARIWNLDAHRAMGTTTPPARIAPELPDRWTDPRTGDVYDLTQPIIDDDDREYVYVDWDGFEPLVSQHDADLPLSISYMHAYWGLTSIITSASGQKARRNFHGDDEEYFEATTGMSGTTESTDNS
ncbi:WD40 repeat domain-containing protein [Sinosporangium siamense]|uniref:WD40 repeat domain-containing protein n=1 Tax=Sinosporangium siamense TaxID=1367973 RepID=A0A919RJB6_9ACTN|nr:hypothetical protein [Sinosporangium siamense]GII94688.1 hypothetical protein Ssi02_49190 [Sinosporangium siamense]